SDLQREDIRSRDRLQSLRDKIMEEAVDALLARVLPIRDSRQFSAGETNDYASLLRLEELEDKIIRSDDQLKTSTPDFLNGSSDSPVDLGTIQRLIKPNEALVLHMFAGGSGFVTTCIESNRWTFNVKPLDVVILQGLDTDYKLLLAAVHASH